MNFTVWRFAGRTSSTDRNRRLPNRSNRSRSCGERSSRSFRSVFSISVSLAALLIILHTITHEIVNNLYKEKARPRQERARPAANELDGDSRGAIAAPARATRRVDRQAGRRADAAGSDQAAARESAGQV